MPLVTVVASAAACACRQLSCTLPAPRRADSGRAATTASDTLRSHRRLGHDDFPRGCVRVCGRGRGRGASSLLLCRAEAGGGGGFNFSNLIKQQGDKYSATPRDEEAAALDAFWLGRGVKEEAYRARLVGMGAQLASSVSERELYRDPDRLGHSLDRLERLFPDIDVAMMMWKEPAVLHLPLAQVAKQLIALRWSLPREVDIRKVVEGNPGVLLGDVRAAAAAVAALQEEFPVVDVSAVVEMEPSLLSVACDLPGRLRRLRHMRQQQQWKRQHEEEDEEEGRPNGGTGGADMGTRGVPRSLETFYDGGMGSTNVNLFAKVFLEETRAGGWGGGVGGPNEPRR